ncbi:MAG: hypothetical protein CSA50_05585 [Gammaproteobacteria bacterium]|nr:MAG: hypothetical protein CSA50_05585 [Gammaproteobacteria bacterium]
MPHLFYTLGGHHSDSGSEQKLLDELTNLHAEKNSGLIEWYKQEFKSAPLKPLLVNSLFVADRLFDGFFRKNSFADSIYFRANKWRYLIAYVLVRAKDKTGFINGLLKIIDLFLCDQIGVTDSSASMRSPFSRGIETLNRVFFSEDLFSGEKLDNLLETLKKELEAQNTRRRKLVTRLLESENGLARAGYATDIAHRIVAERFNGRALPEVVETFLLKDWAPSVTRWISLGASDSDKDVFRELTRSMGICFACAPGDVLSAKSNSSFMDVAPKIIDSLDQEFTTRNSVTSEMHERLAEMQKLIIQLLQNKAVATRPFTDLPCRGADDLPGQAASTMLEQAIADESWFVDMELAVRFQIAGTIAMTNNLLLINNLGAKVKLISAGEANNKCEHGVWQVLPRYKSLVSLFDETVKGLSKVSEAQLKQRKNALEKAKSEALAMRKARQEAEQNAKEAAEKIRIKAEQEQNEENERVRLKLETQCLAQLDKVTLGAWIEYERNEKKEKGKLVVKTASTQKWIFVDRYGLNRYETTKSKLLKQLIEGRARILNAGAAFDESLERTVSRIRMSRT